MNKQISLRATLACAILAFFTTVFSQTQSNYVDATVYKYVSDGCWCWFQDERAVIDTNKNKLVIGTANMQSSVDLTIFDLATKKVESSQRFAKLSYADDHNSPGICIAPNGNYVAMWCHHYDSYNTHYSIYNGQSWSAQQKFDWSKIPGGTNYTIAYSNVYYLSAEKRMVDFARANDRAPNFLYSEDNGATWKFGGQLTTNSSSSYNKGYYKYWSNGVDRIDMTFTEQHPRDFTTSIYHGYIQNGKTYNTKGEIADDDIYDRTKIPTFDKFTKVFAHGTKVNGATMGRCWQLDISRYNDGTIVILFEARADDQVDDHRYFYARYNGTDWKVTYLGKAGKHIYGDESDYVGLGSVNPDSPDRIYLSTTFNPGDDNQAPASKREIWRGLTSDKGATWKWEKVTANSTVDNFRPIVPKWKSGKEALLWFRGVYTSAQNIKSEVVGTFYDIDIPVKTVTPGISAVAVSDLKVLNGPAGSNTVNIRYDIPKRSSVKLQVFSTSGIKVATLINKNITAGSYTTQWNTAGLPAGKYIVRISIGNDFHVGQVTIQH